MADLSTVVRILFLGTDEVSDKIKGMSNSFSALNTGITDILTPFANLASGIEKVDAVITAIVAVITYKAIQASNEYGKSIADLNRFMDEGEGKAGEYKGQFEDLSIKYGQSINDVIGSTADWKAANYDIQQSLGLTKTALDFASVGNQTAAESTSQLKAIIAGLAVPIGEANDAAIKYGDTIAFIGDESSVGFKEIAESISLVAPNIKSAGTSFTEMAAVTSVLSDSLQSGTLAGHAINEMIAQISSPSAQAQKALKELGVEVNSNGITQENYWQVLNKLAAKWPELTAAQKNEYSQMLLSGAEAPRLISILDNWGNVTDRVNKSVTESQGYMAKNVAISLDTTKHAFESFFVSIDSLLINAGQSIDPSVAKVIHSLTSISTAINSEFDTTNNPFKPLIDLANSSMLDLNRLFESIAENLPAALSKVDFTVLKDALSGLIGEFETLFKSFFGETNIDTVDGLAIAIQKTVNAISSLVNITSGIVQSFNPFVEVIGGLADKFANLANTSDNIEFGKFIGSAQALVNMGIAVGTSMILIADTTSNAGEVVNKIFSGIKVVINGAQVAFDGAALGVVNLGNGIANLALSLAQADEWFNRGTDDSAIYEKRVNDIKSAIAGLEKTSDAVAENQKRNKKELDDAGEAYVNAGSNTEQFSVRLKDAKDNLINLDLATKVSKSDFSDWSNGLIQAAENSKKLESTNKASNSQLMDWSSALVGVKDRTIEWANSLKTIPELPLPDGVKVGLAYHAASEGAGIYSKAVDGISTSYEQVAGVKTVKATDAFKAVDDSAKKTADSLKQTAKEANDFKLKMEEIASNERIKQIDAVVSINTERLKADTERVKSLFASIDTTIKSTGDLIGSLFGNLIGTDDPFKATKIESQIALENDRRQKALDIQKELAEAEIDRINAQTRALDRGDSILKIDGTNLEPELRAFMFKIIQNVAVTINGTKDDFLLALSV